MLMEKIAGLINIKEADVLQNCITGSISPITQDDLLKVASIVGRVKVAAKGGSGGNVSASLDGILNYLKPLTKNKKVMNFISPSDSMTLYNKAKKTAPASSILRQKGKGVPWYQFASAGDVSNYEKLLLEEGYHPWEAWIMSRIGANSSFGLSDKAVNARRMAKAMANKGIDPASAEATNFFKNYHDIVDAVNSGVESTGIDAMKLKDVNNKLQDLGLLGINGYSSGMSPADAETFASQIGQYKAQTAKNQRTITKLQKEHQEMKNKRDLANKELSLLKKQNKAEKDQRIQDQLNKPWWQNPGAAATLGIGTGAAGLYGTSAMMNALSNRNDDRRRPAIML